MVPSKELFNLLTKIPTDRLTHSLFTSPFLLSWAFSRRARLIPFPQTQWNSGWYILSRRLGHRKRRREHSEERGTAVSSKAETTFTAHFLQVQVQTTVKEEKSGWHWSKRELDRGEALRYFHLFRTLCRSVSTLASIALFTIAGICRTRLGILFLNYLGFYLHSLFDKALSTTLARDLDNLFI